MRLLSLELILSAYVCVSFILNQTKTFEKQRLPAIYTLVTHGIFVYTRVCVSAASQDLLVFGLSVQNILICLPCMIVLLT